MKNVRRLGTVLAAMAFLVPLFGFSDSESVDGDNLARLSTINGDVSIERASDLGLEKGEVNMPVVEGDKLVTGEGRAEIQLNGKNYLRIDDNSRVEFVALPGRDDDRINIHLPDGQIFLRINSLEREKSAEIHTPDASFYVLEEGLFRFHVKADRETEIFVYQGSVEAAGANGSLLVQAKQKLVASDGEFNSDPEEFYARMDEFDGWNESRDDILGHRSASSYLPSAISDYEEELEGNGRWIYERPYGYVWVPIVQSVDWRPYHYGRWAWYPIIGWTWIPTETWGWCTSHYGRWHWRFSLGWYWIPMTRWGPAWVHWYWDDHYVGWCPLSYYNRPVVIINNRFYDRYYERHYPVHSRALTIIHRAQLQSPDVSRRALRGSELSSLNRISLRAQQPAVKPVLSRTGLQASATLSRTGSGVIGSGYKASSSLSGRGVLAKVSPAGPSPTRRLPVQKEIKSDSPIREFSSAGRSIFGSARNIKSGSTVRTYPSRRSPISPSDPGKSAFSSSLSRGSFRDGASSAGSFRSPERGIKTYAPKLESRSLRGMTRSSTVPDASFFRKSVSSRTLMKEKGFSGSFSGLSQTRRASSAPVSLSASPPSNLSRSSGVSRKSDSSGRAGSRSSSSSSSVKSGSIRKK